MTVVAIHQPQYLPWIPYFAKAASSDVFVYLDNVQFQKNGVQNRNQIKTPNGPVWLTVPVRTSLQTTIQDTEIDQTQSWRQKHLRSIEHAYSRAPHKELVETGLRQVLESDWNRLGDLNIALSEWMFDQLGVKCKRIRASELDVKGKKDDLVIDICRTVGAKTYLSGHGAKDYQDKLKFNAKGIQLEYLKYELQTYTQCWPKHEFIKDLSALDLILNAGKESIKIMQLGMRKN